MKNKWKKGFFLLLGIDLLIAVLVISLILIPANEKKKNNLPTSNKDAVSFYIKSNKNDLNQLINHYLKKEAADTPIDYQVHLGNEVELYGEIPFFSEKLNMKLTFEPKALENGDLLLKQKSIALGSLHLPVSNVLTFIRENYQLPAGVDIRPRDKLVYINMQNLKLKSDTKVKVNKFDLQKDDIAFTLLVPVE
ncbi:YpmS family protein [Neobacillus sp. PS3-40]|uniref:YpmS family protein n=1 Tax=Neobacillus sp. PS3-40 TaxID=3070679 RepID=UPI0027DF48D7|nr:YpmS family protein [Neobacillus sp. PS3-40]WML45003.1 YpmS family protein [Neobacillus sp. PS3-40]